MAQMNILQYYTQFFRCLQDLGEHRGPNAGKGAENELAFHKSPEKNSLLPDRRLRTLDATRH